MEPFFFMGLIVAIVAALRSDEGGGTLERRRPALKRLPERRAGQSRGSVEIIRPASAAGNIPKAKGDAEPVRPMPVWMEHGWTFTSRGYVGKYKTPYGAWDGRAYYDRGQGELRFVIYHPPEAALTGSHRICFRKTEEPAAYWVHLNTAPADVFAGIQGIQRTLRESFKEK